jgi:hypothetical protein
MSFILRSPEVVQKPAEGIRGRRELSDVQGLTGCSLGLCLLAPDGKHSGSPCYDTLRFRRITAKIADQLGEDVSVATCKYRAAIHALQEQVLAVGDAGASRPPRNGFGAVSIGRAEAPIFGHLLPRSYLNAAEMAENALFQANSIVKRR